MAICDGKWDQFLVISFHGVKINSFDHYVKTYQLDLRWKSAHRNVACILRVHNETLTQTGGSSVCDGKQN